MRENYKDSKDNKENKESSKSVILLVFKIVLILLLYYCNYKYTNKKEKLKKQYPYYFTNIYKYEETIDLIKGGSLQIFKNPSKGNEIETKTEKIFKSDIVFLIIPGGSYKNLGISERDVIAKKFFYLGYSSAILKYSVYPECYPNNYNQGLLSIKILSSKFSKIILMGFSAGGHLAGLLGTTERDKLFNCVGMILCYPVISFVKNVHEKSRNNFFGILNENNEKNQQLFSIENRVNKDTLPTFIWTVQDDKVVPYENTVFMIEKLKEFNITYDSIIFEKGRHGMALADHFSIKYGIKEYENKTVSKWVESACDFVENVIKKS